MEHNFAKSKERGPKVTDKAIHFWLKAIGIYWRCYKLNKMTGNILKGVGVGMVAGIAVGMASGILKSNSARQMKRTSKKAIHAVENVLDKALYMMK